MRNTNTERQLKLMRSTALLTRSYLLSKERSVNAFAKQHGIHATYIRHALWLTSEELDQLEEGRPTVDGKRAYNIYQLKNLVKKRMFNALEFEDRLEYTEHKQPSIWGKVVNWWKSL